MKRILLIWDIDGTLIDSGDSGKRALEETFKQCFNIEDALDGVDLSGRLDAWILQEAFKKYHIIDTKREYFIKRYCKILEQLVQKERSIEVLPGIRKILEFSSHTLRIDHALGTGNLEKGARIKLNVQSLNEYFPIGGFGDTHHQRFKVVYDAIIKAYDFYDNKYEKEDIYVIGDTPRDIECGKQLGVRTIAVATGSYSIKKLSIDKPDYLRKDLRDINSFLEIFQNDKI